MADKPQFKPVAKMLLGEAFTIAPGDKHKGGVVLAHTTATIYPHGPLYEVAFADLLNKQVPKRPSLLGVIGVGKQVWPNVVTTQNVDVKGDTANIPCGYGQYAAAKAVTDLVVEDVITQDLGNSIFGIAVQQFHHWDLTEADAEWVVHLQYACAKAAILKALGGGGSYEDTKKNVDQVHELVSKEAFGKIDPARIKDILAGNCELLTIA